MNLIHDPWIPVIRQDGSRCRIAPWQIAETDNPVVELDCPRPDFQGGMYQFLIGLLQCCSSPEDVEAWADGYETPPDVQELSRQFAVVSAAFELHRDAGKPAFLQDFDLDGGEEKEIAGLLIEAPGGKTLKDNLDFFIKGGTVQSICSSCVAQALFTLQTNAPSGGVGHRVGLRGGGPLTTLLQPTEDGSLWQKLWLNVLDSSYELNSDDLMSADVFPWLGKTRVSDKNGQSTLPGDVHSLQMYWGMPRRIRLLPSDGTGQCDLCGCSDSLHSRYVTRNYGTNYEGPWLHPLTPYRLDKKNEAPPLSLKGQKGGLGYRHWLGLAISDASTGDTAAAVVQSLVRDKEMYLANGVQLQLWCFGYDMDNMKARCWYDHTLPVFLMPDEQIVALQRWVETLLLAAREASPLLRKQIKEAWYRHPENASGDISFIETEFWQKTESLFYQLLARLADAARLQQPMSAEIKTEWFKALYRTLAELFDQYALSSCAEDMDLNRVLHARATLFSKFNSLKAVKALKSDNKQTTEVANG
jgi:CRISPR system Cascade subunit CasA